VIIADNSGPETISYIRNAEFRIEPYEKWSGSVEDGMSYGRSFVTKRWGPNFRVLQGL
jgi:hypothetical protein